VVRGEGQKRASVTSTLHPLSSQVRTTSAVPQEEDTGSFIQSLVTHGLACQFQPFPSCLESG
jgi:hypothetical protein